MPRSQRGAGWLILSCRLARLACGHVRRDIFEEIDTDEYGEPITAQVTYPPFDGTDLTATSFLDAMFVNADFRHAENILQADFTGATGLETAEFDDEPTKQAVLKMAAQKK